MNAELSRRMSKVMPYVGIREIMFNDYKWFVDKLANSRTFDDLPDRIKKQVINAEHFENPKEGSSGRNSTRQHRVGD